MLFQFEPYQAAPYAPIYRAYLGEFERLRPLFAYAPDAFAARARDLDATWHGQRAEVAQALAVYQTAVGGSATAAQRLAAPEALAVVAGQQAGLLTGPLYTIYKAITLVTLAARLESELGRPVVPVYWIASEDNDFSEVASTYVLAAEDRLLRLTLPPVPGAGRRPAGGIAVPHEAAALLDQLAATQPRMNSAAWEVLRGTLRNGDSLATWFARQLAALFGHRGLVLLDPMLPALRRIAAPLALTARTRAAEIEMAVARAGHRLADLGFTPSLTPEARHTQLFIIVNGERHALFRAQDAGDKTTTRDGAVYDLGAIAPEQLSYGVVLRPVVETLLLPTLAHVSGPGEVAYQAQLAEVFRILGMSPPVIVPRLGLTLVEAGADAGVPLAALGAGPARAADALLARGAPIDIEARLEAERANLRARYASLSADLAPLSPALAGIAAENLQRVLAQLDYLEKKARQHYRRAHRDFTRQIDALCHRIFPLGRLQEQVLNVWPFLLRDGLGWLDALGDAAPHAPGHWVARWTAS